jgi:hypothetical protein
LVNLRGELLSLLEDPVLDSAMLPRQKQTSAKRTDASASQRLLFNSVAHLLLPFCSQLCIFLLFCYYSPGEMAAGQATMYVCPCNCYLSVFWTMQVCSSDYSYEYFISHERCLICVFQKQEKKSTVVYMLSITHVIPFDRYNYGYYSCAWARANH